MKKLFILKLGGSIVTDKNTHEFFVYEDRLTSIAQEIVKARKKDPEMQLIIIHGAGGPGHHLAKKYALKDGTGDDPHKLRGAILSRITNQKLNTAIFDIFVKNEVPVMPTHTGSIIVQKNKDIATCHIDIIQHALNNNYIPIMYGDMVFDEVCGLSICSGDTSAAYLAKKLNAHKVFFATDIDGIFTKDPHKFKDTKLIEDIHLKEIFEQNNIQLDSSHNTDVTNGLRGKLHSFKSFISEPHNLKEIIIFNGMKIKNYADIFTEDKIKATYITVQ